MGPWVDGAYWTLPIEVAFYLLVFLNLFVRRGQYLPLTMAVLGMGSASLWLLKVFRPALLPRNVAGLMISPAMPPGGCLLLTYGCFFALGVLLYLVLLEQPSTRRWLVAAVCFLGCETEMVAHAGGQALHGPSTALLGPITIWTAAVALLVVSVTMNSRFQLAIGPRVVRLTRQIGIATYPLYLFHYKLGQVAIGGLHRRIGYGPALLVAVAFLRLAAWVVSR